MSARITRRQFVKRSATTAGLLAGVGYWTERTWGESAAANERLAIGIIGVGGRGAANTKGVAGENIVALCDVDRKTLQSAASRFPQAKRYEDFREMLDSADLDAVVISTTDHTHAPAALRAMRLGRHVYCEKPLAHTVHEARRVQETYHEAHATHGIATQMGTQIHATDNYRRVVELVQSGAIGVVHEAHVWCNRLSSQAPPPSEDLPTPEHLNWDLWLGPAPYRPYRKGYLPGNLTWNRYWDFGNGILGDMGSHLIDLPFWALDLDRPVAIMADAPSPDPVIYPTRLIIRWQHAPRGNGPHQQEVTVNWYDGHSKPAELLGVDVSDFGIGTLFVGDDGMLLADYGRRVLLPEEKFKGYRPPEPTIPPSLGHHAEWLHACKTGAPTLCNFDYSGRLIEHNLLGTVAHRSGRELDYDGKTGRVTNEPEAAKFLTKNYRKGWEIE